MLLGTVLPAARIATPFLGQVSVSVIDDFPLGLLSLAAGIWVTIVAYRWEREDAVPNRTLIVIASTIAGLISIYEIIAIAKEQQTLVEQGVILAFGIGLWILLAGSVAALTGCVWNRRLERTQPDGNVP